MLLVINHIIFLVFSAVCNELKSDPEYRLNFDTILIDTAKNFNVLKSIYEVPTSGIYFMSFSAGVPASGQLDYSLKTNESTPSPQLLLTHTSFNGELVTSRDDIQYLEKGDRAYISSTFPLYSSLMFQTSWCGFSVDHVMVQPTVAFRAARTSSYSAVTGDLPLDKLLFDVSGGWNICNNQFVIPKAGIYFLSVSSASLPNTVHEVWLRVNCQDTLRTAIRSGSYNGIDSSSQSLLLRLNKGDFVSIHLTSGSVYSDSSYQTSFSGFLYEPKHNRTIAWTLSFPIFTVTMIYGPAYINFTSVLLNEGLAWISEAAVLRIPVSGVFYLKLSGLSYPLQYSFNLILSVNGTPLMNVIENVSTARTEFANLRSRSLIAPLQLGDELTVSIPTGTAIYSDVHDVSFTGFLLQLGDV